MKTAVAFLVFNRPDTTKQVFERIRQARPPKLLVVADGPRDSHPTDPEKCAAARAIIETIDWDCEVLKNYSETNLGCKKRISSGLDWVFEQEEEAIILEDDCLPDPTFFPFCEELLEKYRHDCRIMHISGNNFQFGRRRTEYSYYFSIYNHCWGWATWRRAWNLYDLKMKKLHEPVTKKHFRQLLKDPYAVRYWMSKFSKTQSNKIDTWDYQWTFCCWMNYGLTILPEVNLVTNIGFNQVGTHTKWSKDIYANLATQPITFPLEHPTSITPCRKADQFTQFYKFGFLTRAHRKIKEFIS